MTLKKFRMIFKHCTWARGYLHIETSTMQLENLVLSLWQGRCCAFWTINHIFFPPWAEWPIYMCSNIYKRQYVNKIMKGLFYKKIWIIYILKKEILRVARRKFSFWGNILWWQGCFFWSYDGVGLDKLCPL